MPYPGSVLNDHAGPMESHDNVVPVARTVHSPATASTPQEAAEPPWSPWCQVAETHSGAVILLGNRAYKLKKPVEFGFLDFRDVEARRRVCEREIELNRRLSPDVYLGVGALEGPSGQSEPLVVMRRMPDRFRLSRLLHTEQDLTTQIRRIARQLAAFHLRARTGPDVVAHGTRDALRRRWDANLAEATVFAGQLFDVDTLREIATLAHRFLAARDELFEERIRRGAVVDGHGDLTPDDIFCLPDGPRLLDCLEFDDALRYVDRLDDIAFLAMGLEDLDAGEAAQLLIETWAEYVGDPAPPSLLHHFLAYRAFVRAKVGCLRGAQRRPDGDTGVRAYTEATLAHLRAGAISLVLVGGPPGSGKSTIAGAVADRLGMTTLNSDRLRKEAAGIDPMSSAAGPLGTGIYDAAHTRSTYADLLHRAELLLRRGESVVLDASWTHEMDRRRARAVADLLSTDLVELRCEVNAATASTRVRHRHGISDADTQVAVELRRKTDPWPSSHTIDTSRGIGECVDDACAVIRPYAAPVTLHRRRAATTSD